MPKSSYNIFVKLIQHIGIVILTIILSLSAWFFAADQSRRTYNDEALDITIELPNNLNAEISRQTFQTTIDFTASNSQYNQFRAEIENNSYTATTPNVQAADGAQTLNIDIERQIGNWLEQEYGITLERCSQSTLQIFVDPIHQLQVPVIFSGLQDSGLKQPPLLNETTVECFIPDTALQAIRDANQTLVAEVDLSAINIESLQEGIDEIITLQAVVELPQTSRAPATRLSHNVTAKVQRGNITRGPDLVIERRSIEISASPTLLKLYDFTIEADHRFVNQLELLGSDLQANDARVWVSVHIHDPQFEIDDQGQRYLLATPQVWLPPGARLLNRDTAIPAQVRVNVQERTIETAP